MPRLHRARGNPCCLKVWWFLIPYRELHQAPGVSQRLLGLGAAPVGSTSDDFAALIRAEYDKWGPVIKAAGIRGE